jgi:RNA polymerase sigma-70 factor (ECF subfamily)
MNSVDSHLCEIQRLFLQHADRLRTLILILLPDPIAADDVLQDVFMTLTARSTEFEIGTNFLAWARTITRFKVLEYRKRRFPQTCHLTDDAWELLSQAASEMDDTWDARRAALQQCLEELAPRAREVVQLRYSDERLELDEVARRMSWTIGSVKVALSRARDALWECTKRRLERSNRDEQ